MLEMPEQAMRELRAVEARVRPDDDLHVAIARPELMATTRVVNLLSPVTVARWRTPAVNACVCSTTSPAISPWPGTRPTH